MGIGWINFECWILGGEYVCSRLSWFSFVAIEEGVVLSQKGWDVKNFMVCWTIEGIFIWPIGKTSENWRQTL